MSVQVPEDNPKFLVPDERTPTQDFPIVCIGLSAGGLESLAALIKALPGNLRMAFVVVLHVDPHGENLVPEILRHATSIRVREARRDLQVEPGSIYVIRPRVKLALKQGRFIEEERVEPSGTPTSIDFFLRSLAKELGNLGIAVVLSGTGSDGSMEIEEVKAAGGVVFVQDPTSAKFDEMPRAALSTGCVDFVLPPERIGAELGRLAGRARTGEEQSGAAASEGEEDSVLQILHQLKLGAGVDFSNYKRTTVRRRIERRMLLHNIPSLDDYAQFLRNNAAEMTALYGDMLIKVTSFFRDPESFEALKRIVFPSILKNRPEGAPIRVWVPGCSTGEEVYSIAIVLFEYLHAVKSIRPVQIFATDLSEAALEKARAGIYVENISNDVSQERLRRFFVKSNHHYHVAKHIRDVCVFARQNITADPPFSKMDLISCRNLLIYLEPVLQKRVMPIFHYALNPSGFLFLGSSENIIGFSELFTLEDKDYKIFSRRPLAGRVALDVSAPTELTHYLRPGVPVKLGELEGSPELEMQREADRLLLARYVPAAIVINDNLDILHFRGQTGKYLEPAPGSASFSLFKMAKDGIFMELRSSIQRARDEHAPVRSTELKVKDGDTIRAVDIEVIPLRATAAGQRAFLVVFEEPAKSTSEPTRQPAPTTETPEARDFARLRRELGSTKDYLQSIIEELETTNEELKASHEEVLSSNEELQSTNEELQTAKEEIQSTNEELTTLNEQLHHKNVELSHANNDLNNIVNSVHFPVLILGRDLCIRRFTPMAEKVLGLIPADAGRPLRNIRLNIEIPRLEEEVLEVLESGGTRELEVEESGGAWYLVRIRPYMTVENRIDGALVVLVDITSLKAAAVTSRREKEFSQAIIEAVPDGLVVVDEKLHVQRANRCFYEMFRLSPEDVEHHDITKLGGGPWGPPTLRSQLTEAWQRPLSLEIAHNFPRVGDKRISLHATALNYSGPHGVPLLLTFRRIG